MSVLDVIKSRRSIRQYKSTKVPDDVIMQLIDAARHAPSAGNIQPWEFIIVKDKEVREQLAKTLSWGSFVKDAPVCIVVLGNEKLSPNFFAIDAACATENLLLAAHALNLGACWVAVYALKDTTSENNVRAILNVPQHIRIIAVVPIGYPAQKARPRILREFKEIVHMDKY